MERLNVNVPAGIRARLQAVAASSGRTEGELARDLLVAAIERAEREAFYVASAGAMSPAVWDRLLQVTDSLDALDV